MSGARVFEGDGVFVKTAPATGHPEPAQRLSAERDALVWLGARGLPVPEVVEYGERDGVEWLVITAVRGRSAAEPWPRERHAAVIDGVADAALALHALPVAECPFDRTLAARLPIAELHATRPAVEDLVVCHGDLCLPNVLFDPSTCALTGILDVGRLGVADRYTDLALATRSITDLNPQYDPRLSDRFLHRYGMDTPDQARMTFYRLLDEFS